ncbi:MAG TPA: hypothetical protein VGH49_07915, partial [Xanthobacteraceae bacterium]
MNFHSINRLACAAALALAFLSPATMGRAQAPAPAAAPSAAAIAAAKELVSLKGGATMFDPLVPGVIESAKNSFVPTNPQLIPQLNEVAAQLRKEYDPKRAEILNDVAKVYAQHFTEA